MYKIDKENKEKIIERYRSGESSTSIAEDYEFSPSVVLDRLEEWNIKKRKKSKKYPFNENYFSELNKSSAYWAGFILGDGCIVKDRNIVRIALSTKDKSHLVKLKDAVDLNKDLYVAENKGNPACTLILHSNKIKKDLIELGIKPLKSKNKGTSISIPNEFKSHFWRGVIDADGHYSKKSRGLRVSGNEITIKDFQNWIESLVGEKPTMEHVRNNTWRCLVYSGNFNEIVKTLYKNSNPKIRLERKYNTAKDRIKNGQYN